MANILKPLLNCHAGFSLKCISVFGHRFWSAKITYTTFGRVGWSAARCFWTFMPREEVVGRKVPCFWLLCHAMFSTHFVASQRNHAPNSVERTHQVLFMHACWAVFEPILSSSSAAHRARYRINGSRYLSLSVSMKMELLAVVTCVLPAAAAAVARGTSLLWHWRTHGPRLSPRSGFINCGLNHCTHKVNF